MRYIFFLSVLNWFCSDSLQEQNTFLGAGVDVFKFFGDLSVRIRTTPRNDTGLRWLFRDTLFYPFNYDSTLIRWAFSIRKFISFITRQIVTYFLFTYILLLEE